ncbi:MAG: V-type ATP synthase subunit I [Clostridiales bacterium]|nr:V-type ATP synthase subunit I [Clostridiales bacterium]
MAITKMKRFCAVTLRRDAEEMMRGLQKLRCVDLSLDTRNLTDENTESDEFQRNSRSADIAETDSRLAKSSKAEEFLASFEKKSSSLFKSPDEVSLDRLDEEWKTEAWKTVSESCEISDKLSSLKANAGTAKNAIDSLEPWKGIAYPLPECESRDTKAVCGTLSAKLDTSALDESLSALACVTEILRKTDKDIFLRFVALKSDFDIGVGILSSSGFIPCSITASAEDGYADGKIKAYEKKIKAAEAEINRLEERAVNMASELKKVRIYADLLTTELARLEAEEKLTVSSHTAILTGWVPQDCENAVSSFLDLRSDAYSFENAEEDDSPPVKLNNNKFSAQFEPVIELYSPPQYGSFDPTAIMSLFYFIIFGLMLADVGYGLLLSLGCFVAIKLMKPRGNTRKMLTMFALCGISCTVMGVLFGGYFSDAPSAIMQNWFGVESPPELALLFNPLTSPIPFLAVSLGVGAVHLICALAIKFYVVWVSGKKLDAIFDQGSWIILFLGAGICLVAQTVGLALVALGVLMLVLTQGRSQKNIFMKLFKGIASLYDIVGYISDLLSYSRILALGLASMVIGSVFNVLGTIPGFSVFGVIFFVVIFTVGHLLNLAINLLGTFVHTARLQYIEFFGKFYEDGGRMFEPLTPRSKYVIFK